MMTRATLLLLVSAGMMMTRATFIGDYNVRAIYGGEYEHTLELRAEGDWKGRHAGEMVTLSVGQQDLKVLTSSARSGVSVLSLEGTLVENSLEVEPGTLQVLSHQIGIAARVASSSMTSDVVVVRVVASDSQTSTSTNDLRNHVFESAGLSTQYDACSYGKQIFSKSSTRTVGSLVITDGACAPAFCVSSPLARTSSTHAPSSPKSCAILCVCIGMADVDISPATVFNKTDKAVELLVRAKIEALVRIVRT